MFKLHLIPSKRIKEINVICYTVQQRHPLNSPACSAGRECSTAAIVQKSKQIVVKTRQQHQLYFFFFFAHPVSHNHKKHLYKRKCSDLKLFLVEVFQDEDRTGSQL